jgi:4-diphosphocytidyl-2-C-methyl-D-erythritol kinase
VTNDIQLAGRGTNRQAGVQEVQVPAFAKLNLDLRVLYKRPDGYHELRSVFQTISLADRIGIRFTRSRRTEIRMAGNVDIPDNLIVKAARACLDEMKVTAQVEFHLDKRIPMGAGLGGGSSDAAAVLLALPALAGKPIGIERLMPLCAKLGSDVPFFLLGGTAVVLGRGEELYPLPDLLCKNVLLVSPEVHVSTADAYRALSATLAAAPPAPKLTGFQANLWTGKFPAGVNDFEPVVLSQHPELALIRKKLEKAGARVARMTGSGSTIFGIFEDRARLESASRLFREARVNWVRFVSRRAYRSAWSRRLTTNPLQNKLVNSSSK